MRKIVICKLRNLHSRSGVSIRAIMRRFFAILTQYDSVSIWDYNRNRKVKNIHIGCGKNILKNWLNLDYYPRTLRAIHFNATSAFPFISDSIDNIFSEHMIEHVSFQQGEFMLGECYRVLKIGGKMRISTPDFLFLVKLYSDSTSLLHKKYVDWSVDTYLPLGTPKKPINVVNNFVRDWGHSFIYDESALTELLIKSGFKNIERVQVGRSVHREFNDLENVGRMPDGFIDLESVVLEAQKT